MSVRVARYSVVIPTLNECMRIESTVARVRALSPDVEVIVVDGDSGDGTGEIAELAGARVITTAVGRGIQCAAGAREASGDVLLFLHADSQLPANAFDVIDEACRDDSFLIGVFRLGFDNPHWLLRTYAWFTRFDSMFTRFGDQGIVIRRELLDRLGGFPEVPLFEDVELLRNARRYTSVRLLPATVVTSARMFLRIGVLRAQVLNAWLMGQYMLGTAPEDLADWRARLTRRTGEHPVAESSLARTSREDRT